MDGSAPPDVVGRAPSDAEALLVAHGWRVRTERTRWRGRTPGDLATQLVVPRVIAARVQGGTVELVLAAFPAGPAGEGA